ncbi:MAG: hypothetical protein U0Q03_01870 [Acidimicrobiales bacterium]
MSDPTRDTAGGPTAAGRTLRRWGPLAAIVAVAAAVLGLLFWPSGDDGDDSDAEATPPTTASTENSPSAANTTDAAATTDASTPATPGTFTGDTVGLDTSAPLFWAEADEAGVADTIDWTSRCDTTKGTYAYPSAYAMPCVAPFSGDNGGATATGVTADTIRVVVYQPQDDDPITGFIAGAVQADDTNADQQDTIARTAEMYESFAEMYGRHVEFVYYTATGLANDAVAARADAAAIAELEPFAVWGSPPFAGRAFAEELAARQVMCLCTGGGDVEFVKERSPYLITLIPSAEQGRAHLVEFIGKRLANQNAIHSGEFTDQPRRIALVYIETDDLSARGAQQLQQQVRDQYGVELVDLVPYTIDPTTLQEQAATIVARLASNGVTTVLFVGDPVAPISLTQEATAQDWFPEWVVTGTGYTETTAFARLYDQQQWAHAFGSAWYAAPVSLEAAGAYRRYLWFHGDEPAARETINDLEGTITFLYYWVQATGPDLTPQHFIDTMFSFPMADRASLTSVRLSWGEKGVWPAAFEPDYYGVDDQTEIWWDPEATGVDEIGREGTGMWRYVAGGRRYLPGERPAEPAPFFVEEGSVTRYDELPPGEELPDYPRP